MFFVDYVPTVPEIMQYIIAYVEEDVIFYLQEERYFA